jgi:dephospho-CoA kinase
LKNIGLTGGIGSGKSYIAKIFEALAVPVFYADDEAKKILNEPQIILEVSKALQANITDPATGLVNRKTIAAIVFNAPEKLKLLNQIIHPKVEQNFIAWRSLHSHNKYVIKEAAILFESGSYKNLDGVICVVSPLALRLKRVAARDHQTEDEILKRIQNQWSDEQRIALSNWVIENDEQSPILSQVLQVHQKIISA